MDSPSVVAAWQAHVVRDPAATFLSLALPRDKRRVTRGEAWAEACACAAQLAAHGCGTGDVVLIFLPQSLDGIAFYLGAMLAGCIPSFMSCPSARQDPARYWDSHARLLQRIRPAALVTDHAHAAQMRAAALLDGLAAKLIESETPRPAPARFRPAALSQDAIALLQHSSGTTGLKKGVMLSHRAILAQVASYAAAIDARADDVIVSWLPLYHDMGLIACLMMPVVLGQEIVLLDPFDWVGHPATLFQAIASHRGTLCWLPNFAFEHLAKTVRPDPATMRLDTMRSFIDCSEPCHSQSVHRFAAAFAGLGASERMVSVCYAMAETTFAVSQTTPGVAPRVVSVSQQALREQGVATAPRAREPAYELLSCGRPLDGVRVFAADADGAALPEGVAGELCVSAGFLFDGYFRQPDETALRLRDAVLRTRDRGFIQDGEIFVLGRIDDLLIINGRNFHAAEIEAILNDVPGLKPGRNVAFTVFSEQHGTNQLVLIAEATEPAPATLRASVRQAIFAALGFFPAEVALVSPGWLLKTTSGKIARGANAAKYLEEKRDQA